MQNTGHNPGLILVCNHHFLSILGLNCLDLCQLLLMFFCQLLHISYLLFQIRAQFADLSIASIQLILQLEDLASKIAFFFFRHLAHLLALQLHF